MKNKIFLILLIGLLFAVVVSGLVSAETCGTGLTEGMVSYWTFDDADLSGNNPLDIFGDNDGTNVGATTGQTGDNSVVGEAFSFDGVDDYIDTNEYADFNFGTGDFAVSFWMYANYWDGYTTPISNSIYGPPWNGILFTEESGGGNCGNHAIRFEVGEVTVCGAVITTGTWYHIVGVRTSGQVTVYVNGIAGSATSATGDIDTTNNLYIGKCFDPTYPRHFNGLIDEVAIFNRALSAEEISDLYDLGVAGIGYCEAVPGNLTLSWVSPSESTYVAQNKFWNFTLNLSCSSDGDCGLVNVTLDPWMINELKQGKSLQLDEDGNVIGRPSNTEITGNVIKETNKEPAEKNWLEKIVEFVKEIFRKG